MKKLYKSPKAEQAAPEFNEEILSLSSPGTGIHDGEEGDDDDDPSTKERLENDEWGNLW